MPSEESMVGRDELVGRRRVVVKIGSAVLADGSGLRAGVVEGLAKQVAELCARGVEVAIVSSGAVACGRAELGDEYEGGGPRTIVEKQVAAAIGQGRLVEAWARALGAHKVVVGQVLLTADDLGDRGRFLNARRMLETLLERGVVPIVNENDSVSTDELRVGDNDRLSALVADLVDADVLVMLSSVDGLCDGAGDVIGVVEDIAGARGHVREDQTDVGVGGMATKLDAAEIATRAGVHAVIASGGEERVLLRVLEGEAIGTLFPARSQSESAKKRWMAAGAVVKGELIVDEGAWRAVTQRGASLLPSGVVSIEGEFTAGAVVEIRRESGEVFARGLCAYASGEARRIAGKKAIEIESVLGYAYSDEVVHRDDMVLLGGAADTGETS